MTVQEYAKKNRREADEVLATAADLGIPVADAKGKLTDENVKALDAHYTAQDGPAVDEKADAKSKATAQKSLQREYDELVAKMRAAKVPVPGQDQPATGEKSFLVTPRSGPKKEGLPAARVIENCCDEGEAKRQYFEAAGIVDTHYYAVDVTPVAAG